MVKNRGEDFFLGQGWRVTGIGKSGFYLSEDILSAGHGSGDSFFSGYFIAEMPLYIAEMAEVSSSHQQDL